ncbi:Similar to Ubiquitin carboxyl-terminal hydrolase isozyme L5; acc. no. Q54N38 [Pyronema omphalodes CBS 100304]|uniref:ubiquitinyl hydrolase 1 n=1 Tax=Pyronema omphalodes (strain CBS 100304) TaxID=1076935 RepID=U4L9B0_PYROM|nr:Similar to Ubiquitin carboxyl-terminal hydrolase isozyme L5; acc. no. Q54N38 [Pyronema omphalodes CBS 100304]
MPPTRKQSNRTRSPPPTPRRTKRVKLSKPVPNTEETPAQTEVPEAPPAAHNEPDSIEQAADPETNKEKTDNEELPTVESIPEPTTDTTNTSFNVVVGNTQAEPTLTSTEDEQRKDEPKPEADEQKDEQKDKQPKPSAKAPQEPSLLRPLEFDDGLSSELSSLPDTPAPEPAPESKPESATAPAPTESKAESNVDSKPDPTSSPAWPGWCTIESEPAVFNHLLHSIGVSGAQVTELYSLDVSSLLALGRCYGIIFLFRYLPSSASYADLPCPPGIWFANQVTANACATLALLNIVFNSPVTLSPSIKAFKEFSADLTPPLRGLAVANNERIRDIHNGFGKKMEMVDADIELAEAAGTRLAKGAWKEEETEEGGRSILWRL